MTLDTTLCFSISLSRFNRRLDIGQYVTNFDLMEAGSTHGQPYSFGQYMYSLNTLDAIKLVRFHTTEQFQGKRFPILGVYDLINDLLLANQKKVCQFLTACFDKHTRSVTFHRKSKFLFEAYLLKKVRWAQRTLTL